LTLHGVAGEEELSIAEEVVDEEMRELVDEISVVEVEVSLVGEEEDVEETVRELSVDDTDELVAESVDDGMVELELNGNDEGLLTADEVV
jgi:hypothetical protein